MSLSSNPFALLGDDDSEPAPQQVQAKVPANQAAPAAKSAVKSNVKAPVPNGKPARAPAGEAAAGIFSAYTWLFIQCVDDNMPAKDKSGGKRDVRKPRRGTRGGWHGHGREFDRHSAALPDSDKKVKKGWGDAGEEIADGTTEAPVDTTTVEQVQVSPEEEEPDVKTLSEYLAEKASLAQARKLPAPRKPNEGAVAVDEKWKNAVPLKREEEEDLFSLNAKVISLFVS
jgi:hypothetical protein